MLSFRTLGLGKRLASGNAGLDVEKEDFWIAPDFLKSPDLSIYILLWTKRDIVWTCMNYSKFLHMPAEQVGSPTVPIEQPSHWKHTSEKTWKNPQPGIPQLNMGVSPFGQPIRVTERNAQWNCDSTEWMDAARVLKTSGRGEADLFRRREGTWQVRSQVLLSSSIHFYKRNGWWGLLRVVCFVSQRPY